MLQIKNTTPFAASLMLLPDTQGIDTLYTVVKGTFTLGKSLVVADEQVPVTLADEYHGDPGASSIRLPSDVCLGKPGTDVCLIGKAYAPHGRPTTWMDATLTVGSLMKTVRVFGDRQWRTHTKELTYSISQPEPFETIPLVWERAFGGVDRTIQPERAEARNMVGTGYRASDARESITGVRLPNLEDPAMPVTAWNQTPQPACFAPICAHWEPRRSYAGTYDEAWQKHRAPFLPKNFDPRFFQVAPPGLIARGYLQPGEWVTSSGTTPLGHLQFQLPPVRIEATYVLDSVLQPIAANLDTLILQPDDGRVVLVWRAVLRCDKKARRVNEVRTAVVNVA